MSAAFSGVAAAAGVNALAASFFFVASAFGPASTTLWSLSGSVMTSLFFFRGAACGVGLDAAIKMQSQLETRG